MTEYAFSPHGPFDPEERALIAEISAAIREAAHPDAEGLLAKVYASIKRLDRAGDVLADYPSLFSHEALGGHRRDIGSLLEALERAELFNFDMFLPTRAMLSRYLVMGEMNLYRMLRFVCQVALNEAERRPYEPRLEEKLCHCVYTRLAEDVLTHIASDHGVERQLRQRAILALAQLWERADYRLSDFFPVLEATWNARRRVRATLGTLMGTAEMFALMQQGCDPQFVDYLGRPDCTEDEAAAFREFLFGIFTEQLVKLEAQLHANGRALISVHELDASVSCRDAAEKGDPALKLFDFFRSRHLQAAARRQANLPGPAGRVGDCRLGAGRAAGTAHGLPRHRAHRPQALQILCYAATCGEETWGDDANTPSMVRFAGRGCGGRLRRAPRGGAFQRAAPGGGRH